MVLRFRPVVTSRFALGLLLSGGIGNSLAAEIELPAVNVQGQDESGYRSETAAVGGFSEAPLLDTPASITVINAALIKDQQARLLSEVLRNDASVGDSICHNGVCLTITSLGGAGYTCDVTDETLSRSTLGGLQLGAKLNLERALAVGARFGGHLVQGHVDAVGPVLETHREEHWVVFRTGAPNSVLRYVVEKGSIAVDGVSLTVSRRLSDSFEVALIPQTLADTTLGDWRPGRKCNLEADILAKYVAAALSLVPPAEDGGMTLDWLKEQGYDSEG